MKQRQVVVFSILFLVNAIYLLKYSALQASATLPAMVVVGMAPGLLFFLPLPRAWTAPGRGRGFSGLTISVVSIAILVVLVSTIGSKVDVNREAALIEGWERIFSGLSPYGGRENTSALPGLLLIVLPFVLMRIQWILPLLGYLAYAFTILTATKPDDPVRLRLLLMPVVLLPFLYELVVHSELYFNISIVLLCSLWLVRSSKSKRSPSVEMGIGALLALLLATRGIVLLILLPIVLYTYRYEWRRLVYLVAGGGIGLFVLFVPLLWFDAAIFQGADVQFGYISMPVLLIAIVLSALTVWSATSFSTLLFRIGGLLFAVVAFQFVLALVETGWTGIVMQDQFDIGYFIFPIPVLLASLFK